MSGGRSAARAARTASLITAAGLLLLLSRSEIRKTLLGRPATVVVLAVSVWVLAFLVDWRRRGSRGSDRS